MTGVVIVSSALAHPECVNIKDNGILTQSCFALIPCVGKYLLAFAIFAFASTTILGWFYYGEECVRFLFKKQKAIIVYKVLYVLLIFTGAVSSLSFVWDFANFANGLMVIPNIVSLLLLHKVVVAETRKYLWENKLDMEDVQCMSGNSDSTE
jgi:AGCS family alanine or glycine:cation symporter